MLAVMLRESFQALKTYGKEPEQIEGTINIFNMVLADYSFEKIQKAFYTYLKTNSDMPAPADIANIIDRGNKPPFDKVVYRTLIERKKADPYAYNVLTADEYQYIKDYEKWMVTGKN